MSSSEFIVAINKKGDEPMMQLANLSVEGDLYELLPLIIKEIEAVRS
jgi:electron transfer flavoprotein alpha subunit